MSSTTAPALAAGTGPDGLSLKASLARAERRSRLVSLALVTPLLLFIVASFCIPLGFMLYRAIDNPEVAETLPATVAAMKGWTQGGVPEEPVFAALAADLIAAQKARTTGLVGKRVNYEIPGARSKFLKVGRELERAPAGGPWKPIFEKSDPQWTDPVFWSALKRIGQPMTAFYLLSAVDLRLDQTGALTRQVPDQAIFLDVLFRTLWISLLVTVSTLVLGYPIAHLLASLPPRHANLLMLLVLLPFTTSILVRTTAWVVLLQTNGVLNDVMVWLGLLDERIQLIYNRFGTVLAMTHIQLPFTVLPIYSVMKGISPAHMRAARSLGAGPVYAFTRVYMPQTLPGVGAGCLLTFILSLGYYITPALVGGPLDQMISYFVALYTNRELNWGQASALGAVLLAVTMVFYAIFNRLVGIDKVKLG
ncbi:ABC transporter permease [Prosthecodimorpha staleyi]|uniref:ABC transporter permease n=1 Tax=Prosthecodimorpha staleyi TaxID=2840188 RepID=A0A947GD09_9HYPH|nr:ABC transporter permease [Prosthecodimorpha staleyi]MBT9289761.1 ABC transporter permease [Prosthecodimorpha staleyi]